MERLARARPLRRRAGSSRGDPSDLYPGLGAGRHLTVEADLAGARVDPRRGRSGARRRPGRRADRARARPHQDAGRPRGGQVRDEVVCSTSIPRRSTRSSHAPGVRPELLPARSTTIPRDADVPAHPRRARTRSPASSSGRRTASSRSTPRSRRRSSARVGDDHRRTAKKLGAPYAAGDQVGLSGLQSVYEKRLAGTPRTDVVIVDAKGADRRARSSASPGKARAGGAAHDRSRRSRRPRRPRWPASTQERRAGRDRHRRPARSGPSSRSPYGGFDRALAGTYPPGSTFKVITSAALLAGGKQRRRRRRRARPKITVDGRTFSNFEGEASGVARSRATRSRIRATTRSSDWPTSSPPTRSARPRPSFGFNANWSLGIDAAGGSYPKPSDGAERAASAIGQGRVLASPVQMASVAAAVATGRWRAPTLVTAPAAARGPGRRPRSTPVVDVDAAVVHGERRPRRRHRGGRRAAGRLVRQDGHRRVRQRQPAAHARVVHRLPRRPRLRGDRRGRRRRRPRRRAARGRVPARSCRSNRAPDAPVSLAGCKRGRGQRSSVAAVGRVVARRWRVRSSGAHRPATTATPRRVDRRTKPTATTTTTLEKPKPYDPTKPIDLGGTPGRHARRAAPRRDAAAPDDRRPAQVPDSGRGDGRRVPLDRRRAHRRRALRQVGRRRRRPHPRPDPAGVARLREPRRQAAGRRGDVHAAVRQPLHRRARRRRSAHAVARARRTSA